jgi:hypothetical protein
MAKRLAGIALAAVMLTMGAARAAEIRSKGKLSVPVTTAVMVVSTDPIIQRMLSEDIAIEQKRVTLSGKTMTLTVTLNQQALRPGVSLADIFPGDPDVAELLKAAGAKAPALTDTGNTMTDPYEAMAGVQARSPTESAAQRLDRMNGYSQMPGFFNTYNSKKFMPGADDPGNIYDTAIIARTELSDNGGAMAVVAIVHPGEDPRQVRKLIAEKIANSLLH